MSWYTIVSLLPTSWSHSLLSRSITATDSGSIHSSKALTPTRCISTGTTWSSKQSAMRQRPTWKFTILFSQPIAHIPSGKKNFQNITKQDTSLRWLFSPSTKTQSGSSRLSWCVMKLLLLKTFQLFYIYRPIIRPSIKLLYRNYLKRELSWFSL